MDWNMMLITGIREKDAGKVREALQAGADVNMRIERWRDTPLTLAGFHDAPIEIYSLLIEYGADVNAARADGYTPLIQAAHFGTDVRVIDFLLRNGADITARDTLDYSGDDAMLSAATSPNKNPEILNSLLGNGASIETRDLFGNTPLLLSACNGYFEKAQWLVENGADVNAVNDSGENTLSCAVQSGDTATFRYFFDMFGTMDINDKNFTDRDGNSFLITATANGKFELATYLLSIGADIHKKNIFGDGALVMAARYFCNDNEEKLKEKLDFMKKLLDAGADVVTKRTVSEKQGTMNMYTNIPIVETEETEAIDILLKYGADINERDENGNTAAIFAAGNGQYKKLSRLIALGSDIEMRNNAGNTPLLEAAFAEKTYYAYGHSNPEDVLECVKILLDAGANIEAKNNLGNTVFLNALASPQDNADILGLLTESGADVHARNAEQQCSLTVSLGKNSSFGNFAFLQESGLFEPEDINSADSCGNTPLVYAVLSGNRRAVRFLLDNGAEVNWRGKQKETLLSIAINNREQADELARNSISEMLIDGGIDPAARLSSGNDAFACALRNGYTDLFALMLAKSGGYKGLAENMFRTCGSIEPDNNDKKQMDWQMRIALDVMLGLSMFMSGDAVSAADMQRMSGQWVQRLLRFTLEKCSCGGSRMFTGETDENNRLIHGMPPAGKGADFLSFLTFHADVIHLDKPPLREIWTFPGSAEHMVSIMNDAMNSSPCSVLRFLKKTKGLDMEAWINSGIKGASSLVSRIAFYISATSRNNSGNEPGNNIPDIISHDGNVLF